MSAIALQLERTIGGQVKPGKSIIFDLKKYTSGNIRYSGLGVITFDEPGKYFFEWWADTQSSGSANGIVFDFVTTQGENIQSGSPIKTGEAAGCGVIEIVNAPVMALLINASTGIIYFPTDIPVKASLTIIQIDSAAGPTGPTGLTGPTGDTGPKGDTGTADVPVLSFGQFAEPITVYPPSGVQCTITGAVTSIIAARMVKIDWACDLHVTNDPGYDITLEFRIYRDKEQINTKIVSLQGVQGGQQWFPVSNTFVDVAPVTDTVIYLLLVYTPAANHVIKAECLNNNMNTIIF